MRNITQEDFELGEIIYHQGVKFGQRLKAQIENGIIDPNKPLKLILDLGEIKTENLVSISAFRLALGSPRAGMIGNTMITTAGCVTVGVSALNYGMTQNRAARFFYGLSVACSTSAIASGSAAVIARKCQISETALLSEGLATAFLTLGNKAHIQALKLEGKPLPPNLARKSLQGPLYGDNNGLSFVMPNNGTIWIGLIEVIPFERIGKFVGIGISIYGYSNLVIVLYRYGQQLAQKFKARRKSLVVRKQIKSFVTIFVLRVNPSIYYKAVI